MRRALDPHTVLYLHMYVHVHISHLMLASLALNLVLSHVRWESCPCGSVRALHADDVRPDSSTGRIGRLYSCIGDL